jgi:hypothetical protein
LEAAREVPEEAVLENYVLPVPRARIQIAIGRGDAVEAWRALSLCSVFDGSADVQARAFFDAAKAAVLRSDRRYDEALAIAERVLAVEQIGADSATGKLAFGEALASAHALGDEPKTEELLGRIEALKPAELAPYLRGQCARFRALLAAARGDEEAVEPGLAAAMGAFREVGLVYWLAVTQLELGEWLIQVGRSEEGERLVSEARETFEQLEATPWLERARRTPIARALATG